MATATSLLLCNLVYADPVSQDVTLLGVFTGLKATRFPTPARDFSVFALLVGEPEETGDLVLECREVSTGELCAEAKTRQQLGHGGKRQVHIRLGELTFPRPGSYEFALAFDGELLGQQTIVVSEARQ
jgi:hypothetical protein